MSKVIRKTKHLNAPAIIRRYNIDGTTIVSDSEFFNDVSKDLDNCVRVEYWYERGGQDNKGFWVDSMWCILELVWIPVFENKYIYYSPQMRGGEEEVKALLGEI